MGASAQRFADEEESLVGHGHGSRHSDPPPRHPKHNARFGYAHIEDRQSRPQMRASWSVVLVGIVAWSAIAYFGYFVLDALLAWLSSNGDAVLQSSKSAGDAFGVGKQVGAAVEHLKNTGIVAQAPTLLRTILAPAAWVIWAIGILAIFLLRGLFRGGNGGFSRRH